MSNRERLKKAWGWFGVREIAAALIAAITVTTWAETRLNAKIADAVKIGNLEEAPRVVKIEAENEHLAGRVEKLADRVAANTTQVTNLTGAVNSILVFLKRHEMSREHIP